MAIQELNLATKEKQDEILSNFPIDGGTNLFELTPVFSELNGVPNGVVKELINISGEGLLMNVLSSVDTASSTSDLTIIVDGKTILDNVRIRRGSGAVNFLFNIPFFQSLILKIGVYNGYSGDKSFCSVLLK